MTDIEQRARELEKQVHWMAGPPDDRVACILAALTAERAKALEEAATLCETVAMNLEKDSEFDDVAAIISSGARRNAAYQIRDLIPTLPIPPEPASAAPPVSTA